MYQEQSRRASFILLLIAVAGLCLRLLISPYPGHGFDMRINQLWMKSAVEFGIVRSFHEQLDGNMLPDHGPVEIGLYAGAGHLQRWLGFPQLVDETPTRVFAKLPSILADVVTCILLFFLLRRLRGTNVGLVAAGVYAFHPAVFHDSAVWGQTDGIYTGFVVASLLFFLARRPVLTGALYAAAVMQKPHALIFLPLLIFAASWNWKFLARACLGGLAVFSAIAMFFALQGGLERMMDVYLHLSGKAGRLSFNAYNLWWALFGPTAWDRSGYDLLFGTVKFHTIGLTLFAATYILTLVLLRKKLRSPPPASAEAIFFASSFVALAFFTLNAGMHERYLFAYLALGIPLIFVSVPAALVYALVSLIFYLNLLIVQPYHIVPWALPDIFPTFTVFLSSALVCALFCNAVLVVRKAIEKKPSRSSWQQIIILYRSMQQYIQKQGPLFLRSMHPLRMPLVIAGIALAVYIGGQFFLSPVFARGTYSLGNETQTFEHPLSFSQENTTVIVDLNITLPRIFPTHFRITPDDCLEYFSVNGVSVPLPENPHCEYDSRGNLFFLASHLYSGENHLHFVLRNRGGQGGLEMHVDPSDPPFFLIRLSFIIFILSILWGCLRLLRLRSTENIFLYAFLGGALLRFIYFLGTPYLLRSYDAEGHLEYIRYVLDHFRIPPAQGGWEFFQPPFYYFLSATFALPVRILDLGRGALLNILQLETFLISCSALAVGLWIGKMLFPRREDRIPLSLFSFAVAVYPGIVYFASRISNDSLIVLLSFAFFGFLYRWWQRGSDHDWYIASIFLALGMLTKANAMALGAVLLGSVLLRKGISWKKTGWLLLSTAGIIAVLVGWLFLYRFAVEGERHLVGNIHANNPGLQIETVSVGNFVTFRPIEVLRHPYNSSWSDAYGRRFFWEHLLKSSLIGEWDFGSRVHHVTRILLAILMLLGLCAVAGAVRDLVTSPREHAPLWLTAVILLGSMMALVVVAPIGGFQDFRYVPLLLIPAAYYCLTFIQSLPRTMRQVGWGISVAFLVLCLLLLLILLYT